MMKHFNKLKKTMSNVLSIGGSSSERQETKSNSKIDKGVGANDKLAEDPPRREFISKALLGGAGAVAAGSVLAGHGEAIDWHTNSGYTYDDSSLVTRLTSLESVDVVHNWNTIINKPSTFTPSSHSHDYLESRISTLESVDVVHNWNTIINKPSTFTPSSHSHDYLESRISTLESVDPVHDWNNIINKPQQYPSTAHTHSDYSGINHTHSDYSVTSHSHSNYSDTNHSHSDYSVTNHSHSNYSDTNHSHSNYSDINHTHSGFLTGTVSASATANTIVKRDGSADVLARQFKGVATSAQWADLAEKYEADTEYDEGVVLGVGGKNEVTEFQPGMPLAGVVSFYPAFKMNDKPEHANWPYLALKGRVPVKITGQATKGNYIIADSNGKGIAMAEITPVQQMRLIGIALEDGFDTIEVKI